MPIGRFSLWAMTLPRYIVTVQGDIGRTYQYTKLSYVGIGELSTPRILDTEGCKLPASTVGDLESIR